MPKKEFEGGSDEFGIIAQGSHGHRAAKRHTYEDMSDAELYQDLDARRNVVNPTRIDFDGGDQDLKPGQTAPSWESDE